MNGIQVFNSNQFGQVRTVTRDGEPWFVAADVCRVLDLSNSRETLKRLDDDEKDVSSTDTLGGPQKMTIVNEYGLYSLVIGSRKPEAKAFKRWITHEVIPAIRKTGGYVSNDDMFINTYLPFADEQTKLLFRSTLETVKGLNAKIEQDRPKVLFADAVASSEQSILIGELAKLIRQNGVDIGRTRLFEFLRENGYLIKYGEERNTPTQYCMNHGWMEIKETAIHDPDGKVRISKTPKITGRGQHYFVNKLVKDGVMS